MYFITDYIQDPDVETGVLGRSLEFLIRHEIDGEWQIATMQFWLEQHGFTSRATPYDK